jgi:hypothetical protein
MTVCITVNEIFLTAMRVSTRSLSTLMTRGANSLLATIFDIDRLAMV